MFISIGDLGRLRFLFNRRIEELEKMVVENPDLKEEIDKKIYEYKETLSKYEKFESDED